MTHRWTSEEHVLDYLLGSIRAGVARDRALTISRNGDSYPRRSASWAGMKPDQR